jgi:hypothetical protein
MSQRDWQTGSQRSLGWKAASSRESVVNPISVTPHLRSCIAVVGEPKSPNLHERSAVPIARYFIFVGGALAALLFITGRCLPTPPAMFANQLAIDRSIIRTKSAHKWPERLVLDTGQRNISVRPIEEPPAARLVRLLPDEAGDQPNLEALAQFKRDQSSAAADQLTLRIKRGLVRTARSKHVARGPVTRWLARAEAGGAVVSLGGSRMVKQPRMLHRAGAPRRHGLWIAGAHRRN